MTLSQRIEVLRLKQRPLLPFPFFLLSSPDELFEPESESLSESDLRRPFPLSVFPLSLFLTTLHTPRRPQQRKQPPQQQVKKTAKRIHCHHDQPPSSQGQWKANQFHSHGNIVNSACSSSEVKVPSFSGHRCRMYSPAITDRAM